MNYEFIPFPFNFYGVWYSPQVIVTMKVERKGNELIVHIALTERPSWDRTGVILASEGWQDIGYGLKMQLTIASTNIILQNERIKLIQKPGILNRLRGKKIPMLEDKS